ncbi:YugN family protein [Cohnella massiliensis]|uniref:YugN family protein n=1 Tax=Cohnella massiliensis TaxID=1816691 RepID=UPI0009B95A0C|nr:YugN family protein [Cohnella massiliensis]
MYAISSSLTGREREFASARRALGEKGFSLGGNWDYRRGSFDCALDEAQKVYLRLPFVVTRGSLDSETDDIKADIRFEEPYVLKHVYNEGLDPEAQPRTLGATFDQFSDPLDSDADIEPRWIETARGRLSEAEQLLRE